MKRLNIGTLAYCLIVTLFFSCTQELVQPTGTDGETVSVRLNITTAPMQAVGNVLTRATTDKTGDELAVHRTWVLQFNGNVSTSRLLKAEEVTFTNNALETELLHTDATCRVYVVANSDCTPLAADAAAGNGISLADFEASLSAFAPTRTIDASTGLPMCAYQDFNPRTDAPAAAFTLKPLVVKLTFRLSINPDFTGFTVSAITLKQVASGTTFKESGAGNEAVRPSGATYTGELDLAGADAAAVTCYLPENLSGRNTALKSMWQRGKVNAPESATYVEIIGTAADGYSYGYSFFLGDGTPQDFNVARNYHYNLTATLNGTSEADLRTELLSINLNAGGKTANCYLVPNEADKYYAFDATVMGNGATTPADGANTALITPTALAPASAAVLWEQSDPTGASNTAGDVVKNVRFSDGYIHFTTGTKPGNAVIAALDGSNNIIWSWHIWRPEANPGDVECYTPKNGGRDFKMMALNLGALNNEVNNVKVLGLLYQWGRKDPFPGATGISANDGGSATFNGVVTENGYSFAATDISSSAITVANAVAAPMSFYSNGSRRDWVSVQQDNLWGNPFPSGSVPNPDLGSKSIYDPCPLGYRVAPQDTWGQATASDWVTNGQNLKVGKNGAKYFYPAAGLRWGDSGMGKLAYVGSYGNYWSSSPYSNGNTGGGSLYFNDGYVSLEFSNYRAYGMSVRCVQE